VRSVGGKPPAAEAVGLVVGAESARGAGQHARSQLLDEARGCEGGERGAAEEGCDRDHGVGHGEGPGADRGASHRRVPVERGDRAVQPDGGAFMSEVLVGPVTAVGVGDHPGPYVPSVGGDMFPAMRTAFAAQRGLDGGSRSRDLLTAICASMIRTFTVPITDRVRHGPRPRA